MAADSILRLKVESQEYDAKLKRATDGLTRYIEGCRKVGGTLSVVEKETLQYVQALGKMETVSQTAKGTVNEMTKAFTELSVRYNRLTAEEKASPFGQSLNTSLQQLATRIKDSKAELKGIGDKIGGFKLESTDLKSVLGDLGSRFGINSELLNVMTTGTVGLTAAIGASVAGVVAATKAWADYNVQLAHRDTDVRVITGITDDGGVQRMSDAAKAMADVYNVDVRDALNAVNTLIQQFGISSDDALQLVRDGLQGMLQGDGPKLLNMIQQYAPSFRDAGISASQLVAIIHNSEGGIFTDANMNAIVMGIKNIRLMTNATSEALSRMGIDGQEMTRKLNDGTMSIFDALKLVADKLGETEKGSQTAGEVMQQVFGRQGVAAGTNLSKAIATLNTNLEETKKQTGELGDQMAELENKSERLNQAFRDAFAVDGLDGFINKIKGDLMDALSSVIEALARIRKNSNWGDFKTVQQRQEEIYRNMLKQEGLWDTPIKGSHKTALWIQAGQQAQAEWQRDQANQQQFTIYNPNDRPRQTTTDRPKPKDKTNTTTTRTTPKVETPKTEEQLNTANIQKLTQEYITASEERRKAIREEISTLQDRNKEIQHLKDEATGKTVPIKFDVSQIPKINLADYVEEQTPHLSTSAISSFISEIKKQIDTADFGSTLYNSLTNQLNTANGFNNLLQEGLKQGVDFSDLDLATLWQKITEGISSGELDGALIQMYERVNQARLANGENALDYNPNGSLTENKTEGTTGDQAKALQDNASKMVSGLQTVASGLQTMGIELPSGVTKFMNIMQGAMSIIQGVQTVISVFASTTQTANTAASIANTAALAANTAALGVNSAFSLIPFANGGVVRAANGFAVPGNSYSGDQVPALLNSGELVLNRAQQGNLASQLDDTANLRSMGLECTLKGEDIRIALNNNIRRKYRGELAMTNIQLW